MENEKKNVFKEFLISPLGKFAMIAILYVVIMMLFALVLEVINAPILGVILAVVFGIFGWQALNKITPDIFLFMSVTGWIIYFCVKGFLSVFLGVFVAPFVIAKKVTAAIQENI